MEHWETVDGQLDSKEMVANDVSSTLKVALFGGGIFPDYNTGRENPSRKRQSC